MKTTYEICPFTTKEERILVSNSIPFIRKGNTALFNNEKDFVRASFRLIESVIPTTREMIKGVL